MRVLQVMAGAENGGAEKFFDRLTPALARQGVEQHVVCRPFEKHLNHFRAHQIPVSAAPFRRLMDFQTHRIIKCAPFI